MNEWQEHYTRPKARLLYPDENLVRMLAKTAAEKKISTAIDLGCGSGRHLSLLRDFGITCITGTDASRNALVLAAETSAGFTVLADNMQLPFKDSSADLITAWGSLHYCRKAQLKTMLAEIRRVLKPEGVLLATLRSDRDTLMKRGEHLGNNEWKTELEDISGAYVSFFSMEELEPLFREFSSMKYGLMERSLMGNISSIVSHWFIKAEKQS